MAAKKEVIKQVTKKKEAKKADIKLADMMPAELATAAKELRGKITAFHLEKTAGKAKNVKVAYNLRKQLARTLTTLKLKSHA